MPRAKLTLTLPKLTWPGAVTREHPEAVIRVLAAVSGDEGGTGLAEIRGPDIDTILEDMRAQETLTGVELLEQSEDRALVEFRTDMPLLLVVARESGLPLEMPFDIENGRATWELTVTRESLAALHDELESFGLKYDLGYLREDHEPAEPLLTDRQRWLLEEAVERGYYDTPRQCSLTDLAEAVGLAKSTVSETLHRAEERVVKEFAGSLEGSLAEPDAARTAADDTGDD